MHLNCRSTIHACIEQPILRQTAASRGVRFQSPGEGIDKPGIGHAVPCIDGTLISRSFLAGRFSTISSPSGRHPHVRGVGHHEASGAGWTAHPRLRPASFRRPPTLENALQEARTQVEALRQELEDATAASSQRERAARLRAAKECHQRCKRPWSRCPGARPRRGQRRRPRRGSPPPTPGARDEDSRRWLPARLQRAALRRHRNPDRRTSRPRQSRQRPKRAVQQCGHPACPGEYSRFMPAVA
jgi:hypothetical protein